MRLSLFSLSVSSLAPALSTFSLYAHLDTARNKIIAHSALHTGTPGRFCTAQPQTQQLPMNRTTRRLPTGTHKANKKPMRARPCTTIAMSLILLRSTCPPAFAPSPQCVCRAHSTTCKCPRPQFHHCLPLFRLFRSCVPNLLFFSLSSSLVMTL